MTGTNRFHCDGGPVIALHRCKPRPRRNMSSAITSAHSTAAYFALLPPHALRVRWERAHCLGLVLTICAVLLNICSYLHKHWCAILGLNQ
jgi:hypothetical protein